MPWATPSAGHLAKHAVGKVLPGGDTAAKVAGTVTRHVSPGVVPEAIAGHAAKTATNHASGTITRHAAKHADHAQNATGAAAKHVGRHAVDSASDSIAKHAAKHGVVVDP